MTIRPKYAKIDEEDKNKNVLVFAKNCVQLPQGVARAGAMAFLVFTVGLIGLGIKPAEAAPLHGYETIQVSSTGTGQIKVQPGERRQFTIQFLNNGSKTWVNDGPEYVSVYTYGPKYRRSAFDPGNWEWSDHVTRIQEPSVPVGGTATITFELHAPLIEGTYEETFHLASEDTAWIPGGEFTLNILVSKEVESVNEVKDDESEQEVVVVDGYGALVEHVSTDEIEATAGEVITVSVDFSNVGSKTWVKRRLQLPDLSISSTQGDWFHSSWLTRFIPVARTGSVAPGEKDTYTFKFAAPANPGDYTAQFRLIADEVDIPGGEINIPVTVTSGAPDAVNSPLRDDVDVVNRLNEIPVMRVAVLIVDEETDWEVEILCEESDLELRNERGELLANVEAGEEILAYYDDNRYYYNVGRGLEKTSYPLRFEPEQENAVLEVTNFDRRATRSASHADNTFRNVLELRYNNEYDRTWLINELEIEMYLRGLAETSNYSPDEFQKTLITAARTYAFYHWERATKHADEGYHVDAYWDQVYKGYGYEERTPNITEAVQATEGVIVTYDEETAITPYFSRSDGRTRDWSEVWYGEVEWCQSVEVPCDRGETLWGHGVGMSASGALCMAEDGESYDEILHYFYQGIELMERW